MFLSESYGSISKSGVHPSVVVIVNLPMYSEYEFFSCLVLFCISEFKFEFPVIRFLCSVLPGWSLGTHGDQDMVHLEKTHDTLARIFGSLIRMKVLWNDSSWFLYGILYCSEYELFGVCIGECVSYNLLSKVIEYSRKIEMHSVVDDMSEVTPPDNTWMNGTKRLQMIHNLDSSNIFPVHIILFLISRFDEFSSFFHESRYTILLHESSGSFHRPSKRPANTPMSVPWMLFVYSI